MAGGARRFPSGRVVALPGRGSTFVREVPGPPGAPVVLLLHGWGASADLNWHTAYDRLGRHFRVLAPDQRGHARGIRAPGRFRLEDCADDAAALLTVVGVERAVVVGYSMGGPVASLLWRRHAGSVEGLVLCATACSFVPRGRAPMARAALGGLAVAARRAPVGAQRYLTDRWLGRRGRTYEDWARELLASHDWPALVDAMRVTSLFSSQAWIGQVDVPTAVIVMQRDETVPVARQEALQAAMPGARAFRIDADHNAAVSAPGRFVPALLAACTWVAEQAPSTTSTPR